MYQSKQIKAILSEYAWPSSYCFLSWGLFFAANNYHHHIATNIWMGTNILPANNSNNKPGLDHYAVKLSYFKEKEISELKNRLKNMKIDIDKTINESDMQYTSSFYIYDPDRIKIQFLFG